MTRCSLLCFALTVEISTTFFIQQFLFINNLSPDIKDLLLNVFKLLLLEFLAPVFKMSLIPIESKSRLCFFVHNTLPKPFRKFIVPLALLVVVPLALLYQNEDCSFPCELEQRRQEFILLQVFSINCSLPAKHSEPTLPQTSMKQA